MRDRCGGFRYCPDPLGIVAAKQFDKLEFSNGYAPHQSLPCVRGGGQAQACPEGLTIPQSRCSRDSSLYIREPWALPRQFDKLEFDYICVIFFISSTISLITPDIFFLNIPSNNL